MHNLCSPSDARQFGPSMMISIKSMHKFLDGTVRLIKQSLLCQCCSSLIMQTEKGLNGFKMFHRKLKETNGGNILLAAKIKSWNNFCHMMFALSYYGSCIKLDPTWSSLKVNFIIFESYLNQMIIGTNLWAPTVYYC